ncbi:MAG: indolepyruvate oxidoreductase subunit beta [Chitinivibrionales bacterium]
MEAKTYNILFCGVGGQGVLKASEVCSLAALKAGYHVKKSEVHGMSQRGGSVESHLRFGEKVYAPIIQPGKVDYLVCFEENEGKRMSYFLSHNGVNYEKYLVDAQKTVSDARFVNTYMLGVLSAKLPIDQQIWLDSLQTMIPKRIEENRDVFIKGFERGKQS